MGGDQERSPPTDAWKCCFNTGAAMPETIWLEFLNPEPPPKEVVEIPPG